MRGRRPLLVGIAGGSASGKTRLAEYLLARLGRKAALVCQDWYYRHNGHLSPEKAGRLNFDHPDAIETGMLVRDLKTLLSGKAVEAPSYDYATHSRLASTHRVEPAPVIVLDGLFTLCDPRLRRLLDVSVYVDVPDDIRLMRRVLRDTRHRRVDLEETLRLYEHCVRPMHLRFIGPSAAKADYVWRQQEDEGFPARLLALVREEINGKQRKARLRA